MFVQELPYFSRGYFLKDVLLMQSNTDEALEVIQVIVVGQFGKKSFCCVHLRRSLSIKSVVGRQGCKSGTSANRLTSGLH